MLINYNVLGKRIRKFRKKKKMSQEKLAEQAGISTQYMSQIETAARQMSLRSFVNLTEALEVSSDLLLFGSERYYSTKGTDDGNEIFLGCTEYEKRVLKGVIAGTKKALFQNREM